MTPPDKLIISDALQIPLSELHYRTARSGGPGGQHVNRTESQVELLWDVAHAASLSPTQRRRIQRALGNRIDKAGVLHLTASSRRSQQQNKREVTERLVRLVRAAIQPPKKRVPTTPSARAKARRLQAKRHRSSIKRRRGRVSGDDW